MKKVNILELLNDVRTDNQAAEPEVTKTATAKPNKSYIADEEDHDTYTPVGAEGLLASSEKLLAVSRGVAEPDDRDALYNDRLMTPDRLIAERIKLDTNRTLRNLLSRASRTRNLQYFKPGHFDEYTQGFLVGNPLVTATEQVNPMHMMEQQRRITKMGPGGIGDPNAITVDSQCHSEDTEVYTKEGWRYWSQITRHSELACRVDGRLEFHKPLHLVDDYYEGVMYGCRTRDMHYLVTPNHRMYVATDHRTVSRKWTTATDIHGKMVIHDTASDPYKGADRGKLFTLPAVTYKGTKDRNIRSKIDMGDWCEFLGWYMSEGNLHRDSKNTNSVTITQCPLVNPDKYERLERLLDRLPFKFHKHEKNFKTYSKQLYTYLKRCGKGSKNKRLPEFIYEVSPKYRERFIESFRMGDGNWTSSEGFRLSTSSVELFRGLERLLINSGNSTSSSKPRTGYDRKNNPCCTMYGSNRLMSDTVGSRPGSWYSLDYSGRIYCAEVPGSLLLTRIGNTRGIWTGNSVHGSQFGFISVIEGPESERAGVDVRMAQNTRFGSDGKIYQQWVNSKTGKEDWVAPDGMIGKTVKLPD